MAFRATGLCKSTITPLERIGSRFFSSSSSQSDLRRRKITIDDAPIISIGGFVALAGVFAAYTAQRQLRLNPNVMVTKTKRGSISEADDPDQASTSGEKFVNKSFFRRVGRIQKSSDTIGTGK